MRARSLTARILAALCLPGAALALAAAPALAACSNEEIRQEQFASYLPDCRAYELVSPVLGKEGNDIAADPGSNESSLDGNAIKYDSTGAFGDVEGIVTKGAEYVAQREPDGAGWANHGITPRQKSLLTSIYATAEYQGFAEDLSQGVYFALTPITPGNENVAHTANLYLRNDILAGPLGSYELLSDSVNPLPARREGVQYKGLSFDGASADWKHIIFESTNNLTADAVTAGISTALPKLYEWENGTVRLAGILPDGEPADGSVGGPGGGGGAQVLEANYFAVARNSISTDGSRVLFTAGPFERNELRDIPAVGNIYMRINGRETIQLNRSERSEPDPNGPQPATIWGATADDSKVLFTTSEALTDNATGISSSSEHPNALNLYMYDVNAPAGKHLTLITTDAEPSDDGIGHSDCNCGVDRVRGVVGMSADASYVYFLGEDRLIAGQAPIPEESFGLDELYAWHNGTLRAITSQPRGFGGNIEQFWGLEQASTRDEVRVTANGKQIVFATASLGAASAVGFDNRGATSSTCEVFLDVDGISCEEIYIYDYETGKLTCASCYAGGRAPTSNAGFEEQLDNYGTGGRGGYLDRAVSSDGRYVFFDTGDPLVAGDTNGRRDVYEYDTQSGEVHLMSGGTCNCDSTFVDASSDGSNVFFTTSQELVRIDVDTNADLYDARTQGGIAAQNVAPAISCEGDDCQGPAKAAPVLSLPSSSTFAGPGNTSVTVGGPMVKAKHKARPKKHRKKRRQRYGRAKRSSSRVTDRAGRHS